MQLEFFLNFPSMERENLRDLKKGIDLTFKDFSREYGDSIEGFFGPLLKFLVWFEKFLITALSTPFASTPGWEKKFLSSADKKEYITFLGIAL